jgi:hypothetical protein
VRCPVLARTDRCPAAEFTAAIEGGADLPRHLEYGSKTARMTHLESGVCIAAVEKMLIFCGGLGAILGYRDPSGRIAFQARARAERGPIVRPAIAEIRLGGIDLRCRNSHRLGSIRDLN